MRTKLTADQQHDLILNSFQRLEHALMLEWVPHKDALYLRPMTSTNTMRRCINELINIYPLAPEQPFDIEEWKKIYNTHLEKVNKEDNNKEPAKQA